MYTHICIHNKKQYYFVVIIIIIIIIIIISSSSIMPVDARALRRPRPEQVLHDDRAGR